METNRPDMSKIMANLYELWFLEHGAEVRVTVSIIPHDPQTKTPPPEGQISDEGKR